MNKEEKKNIEHLLELAFKEDLPSGDLTTDSLGTRSRKGRAGLLAKDDLILSGSLLFELAFLKMDEQAKFHWFFKDGDSVLAEQKICVISGNLVQFLKAERVALNILSRLSGIATKTATYVQLSKGKNFEVLDTRKTLPCWRIWEKKAVKDGGGSNHRMNLSESLLIKENHIVLAGGVKEAIQRIQVRTKRKHPITVEVRNLREVKAALSFRIKRLLLDNMSDQQIEKALTIIPPSVEVEVSGNMNLKRIKNISHLNIDYISVGAITHSAPSANLTLLLDWASSKN